MEGSNDIVLKAFDFDKHYEIVKQLIMNALDEHSFSDPCKVSVEKGLSKIKEEQQDDKAFIWVAIDNSSDTLIGTITIRPKILSHRSEYETCELKRFYVAQNYRKKGIGRLLYTAAEHFAREKGYKFIWLTSSRNFNEAKKFYTFNGFKVLALRENAWCDNIWEKDLS